MLWLFVVFSCAGENRWSRYGDMKVEDIGDLCGNVKNILDNFYMKAWLRCDEDLAEE